MFGNIFLSTFITHVVTLSCQAGMCFVVTIKEKNLRNHRKDDRHEGMHMCLKKAKKNQWNEVSWTKTSNSFHNGIDFNDLEVSDWKRRKCEECSRIYYAVLVLALLSNDGFLINNLGKILNIIERRSITNGKEIHELLKKTRLYILSNLDQCISFFKMIVEEFSSWDVGKYRPKYQNKRIGTVGYKCKL